MMNRREIVKELAIVFKVLAHRDRILIVDALRGRELIVNELGRAINLGATRVSQHLALMRAHKMVVERRDGRQVFYSLSQPDLAHWITDGLQFVEARAAAEKINSEMISQVRQKWCNPDSET